MSDWRPIETAPEDTEVWTKINDADGGRNVQTLVKRSRYPYARPLWWFPDGGMYVYYQPTHWKPVENAEG